MKVGFIAIGFYSVLINVFNFDVAIFLNCHLSEYFRMYCMANMHMFCFYQDSVILLIYMVRVSLELTGFEICILVLYHIYVHVVQRVWMANLVFLNEYLN